MFLFAVYLMIFLLIGRTSGMSEPDKDCVPNCLDEFEEALAKENVTINLPSLASFTEAKLLNVCRIYKWDSECLDTCEASDFQDAARMIMKPMAQLCTTHYDAILNHARCFEAAEFELGTCNKQCGSIEESIAKSMDLSAAIESDNQQEAFDIINNICIDKLCHLDCEAQVLATNRVCSNTTAFNQNNQQIDELARRLAADNFDQLMASWPILDEDNKKRFPESCRRLQNETPTNNDTKPTKTAHICSLSSALLSIMIALYAFFP
uniref:Uncharacterized protein n=1 Tax=Plectus sambesii TaxID=2011161 RepID=A0A914VS81_9BILA